MTYTVDEIISLVEAVNKYSKAKQSGYGSTYPYLPSKKLVDIYNSNEEFNNGKYESFSCRPCIDRVVKFFQGYVKGYQQASKTLEGKNGVVEQNKNICPNDCPELPSINFSH